MDSFFFENTIEMTLELTKSIDFLTMTFNFFKFTKLNDFNRKMRESYLKHENSSQNEISMEKILEFVEPMLFDYIDSNPTFIMNSAPHDQSIDNHIHHPSTNLHTSKNENIIIHSKTFNKTKIWFEQLKSSINTFSWNVFKEDSFMVYNSNVSFQNEIHENNEINSIDNYTNNYFNEIAVLKPMVFLSNFVPFQSIYAEHIEQTDYLDNSKSNEILENNLQFKQTNNLYHEEDDFTTFNMNLNGNSFENNFIQQIESLSTLDTFINNVYSQESMDSIENKSDESNEIVDSFTEENLLFKNNQKSLNNSVSHYYEPREIYASHNDGSFESIPPNASAFRLDTSTDSATGSTSEVDPHISMHHPVHEKHMLKSSQSFLIGAISGSCQQMISHPLEYIKTVRQYNNVTYSEIFKSILKKPTTAWTGALVTAICYSPRTAVRFSSFEFINSRLENPFLSGAFSGIIEAMTVATVAETIKTKVMVSKEPVLASLRREGFFAIYKGVIPTLGKQIVNHSVRFGGTEKFINWMSGGDRSDKKWWYVTIGAGMSGLLSAILTQPFDVVKSLQQSGDPRYKTVFQCITALSQGDGGIVKHAYRGLGARLARVMLEVSLTFTFYNTIKDTVESYLFPQENM